MVPVHQRRRFCVCRICCLTRDTPLQLWVIIAESVLRHRVGSGETMKAQLEALVEDSRRPNVQLQVLPQNDPMNACLFGPFVIMSFQASSETDIIYAESPTSTLYYEETADVDTYTKLFRRLHMAAANVSDSRALRDSKDLGGPALTMSDSGFDAFVRGVVSGALKLL